MGMVKLGVNIDHVATLRQARMGIEPDVLEAAKIVEKSGAHGITVHLREDRRHIQDEDVIKIKKNISIPLNLEMACSEEIVNFAYNIEPNMCTLVPEKRQEITTEGGLDVCGQFDTIKKSIELLKSKGIKISLFIEPDKEHIECSKRLGAEYIEIHTGKYSNAFGEEKLSELNRIETAAKYALSLGLVVNAGHGLNYENTEAVIDLHKKNDNKLFNEFNIGHSIISRSVFTGLEKAVKDMLSIVNR